MTAYRVRVLLLVVILGELIVAGVFAADRLGRTPVPVPDFEGTDPVTAEELRGLAANCRTPGDWAKLGEVYLATGFFPEAEACLRHADALSPTAEVALRHAFALERIGRPDEAVARYKDALNRGHPRGPDCWYYVGRNHLRMEDTAAAAAAFERAGPLPAARYELALLKARAGRTAEADADARRLADESPAACQPVSLRYRLALLRGDPARANALADQFARRPRPLPSPFDTEVAWVFGLADGVGRARLFRDAGRDAQGRAFAAAEAKLREALAAAWDPAIADRLAEVVFVLGRPGEAEQILADAVERGGPSPELLGRLGQAHDALGRGAEALAAWERAARFATGSRAKDLWLDLADRYDRAGQREKAGALRARSHLAGGLEELDAGRPAAAADALGVAVGADPQLAHAWFALGEAHRFAGRSAEARTAYRRCLQIDPDHGRAARSLELLGE